MKTSILSIVSKAVLLACAFSAVSCELELPSGGYAYNTRPVRYRSYRTSDGSGGDSSSQPAPQPDGGKMLGRLIGNLETGEMEAKRNEMKARAALGDQEAQDWLDRNSSQIDAIEKMFDVTTR